MQCCAFALASTAQLEPQHSTQIALALAVPIQAEGPGGGSKARAQL